MLLLDTYSLFPSSVDVNTYNISCKTLIESELMFVLNLVKFRLLMYRLQFLQIKNQKVMQKFGNVEINYYLCIAFRPKHGCSHLFFSWRDGREVDYNGLENRRTERYRGFESLSLRGSLF